MGGESQKYLTTSLGRRFVDQFADDIAHEAKIGAARASAFVKRQIAKDVELRKAGDVKQIRWHFYRSPVSGTIGPSKDLRALLEANKIEIIIHYE